MVGMQYIHTYTTPPPPKIVRVSCSPTSVHEAKITITTFLIAHRKRGRTEEETKHWLKHFSK